MGLQFRRGTDSDRLGVTPDIGEPLFTTNTKKLFIGDGLTAGGILISGTISDSGDVTSIISGTVDSAYVNSRVDANIDSAALIAVVDSDYVQDRQDYAYSSLTGTPTTVSTFINDANYLDSTTVTDVIDASYVQSNQITYNTSDFVDSAYVATQISNLVDGAPTALDTLNELATALQDDSDALASLVTVVDTKLNTDQVTSLVDSAYVQARQTAQDFAYSSLTGAPTNLSQFNNNTNYLDSTTVTSVIDAAYVQANQTTYDFLDSAEVIGLVDSAYINARTDANIDSAALIALVDSDYVQARQAPGTDSSEVQNIITEFVDSAYVQLRQTPQDFAYGSLTGAPNVLDSAAVAEILPDGTFRGLRSYTFTADSGDTSFSGIDDNGNSLSYSSNSLVVYANGILLVSGVDYTATNGTSITLTEAADSADIITIHNIVAGGTDSALINQEILELIDSAYVQARETAQDFAYSSLTGAPTNVSSFTNDANYLDSTTVTGVIDASYIQANQTTYDFLDSAEVIGLVDSAYVQARQSNPDQSLNTSDSVEFAALDVTGNVVIGGNLQVDGTQTVINTQNLSVEDNMFYLNQLESSGSPTLIVDVGWAGNVNDDGTYEHVGMFRDATDNTFKVFEKYLPEPDAATQINTDHASFSLAPFAARTLAGEYLGFDSDVTAAGLATQTYVTTTIDSAYVQLRQTPQDFAYSSLTGAPTTVSTFTNDANYLDSTTVTGVIDASYIQSNQTTYDFLDSSEVIALIDSDYVQARQAPGTDSAEVQNIITGYVDSAYVQARQAPGTDSAAVVSIVEETVDSAYVADRIPDGTFRGLRTYSFTADSGDTVFSGADDNGNTLVYSENSLVVYANGILLVSGVDYTASNGSSISLSIAADSADVITAHNIVAGGTDSALIIGLIDSDFVQLRQTAQDFAYSSLTGAPTAVSAFTNDANYLDSTTVAGVIDASYIQSNQITYNTSDFVDSAYVATQISNLVDGAPTALDTLNELATALQNDSDALASLVTVVDTKLNTAGVTSLVDSAYVQARQTTYDFLDSAETIAMLASDSFSIGGTVIGDGKIEIFNGTGSTPSYIDLYCEVSNAHYTRIQSADHGSYSGNVTLTTPTSSGTIALTSDIPTAVSSLTNDAGYTTYDSTNTLGLIDSAYINARVDAVAGTDSAATIALIQATVDSDYVQARQSASGGGTVDSAYVLSVLDGASQAGASDFLFTADSGQTVFTGLDNNSDSLSFLSTSVQVFLNGILLRQVQDFTTSGNNTVTLTQAADSGDELTVFSILAGSGTDSAATISLIENTVDSDYIAARSAPGTDSATVEDIVRSLVDSDYIQFRQLTQPGLVFDTYSFTADSAQSVFNGADDNNLTLQYNVGDIQVFRNGILLVDSADYTASSGTSVTLISAAELNDNISIASFTTATNEIRMDGFEFTADSGQTVFTGLADDSSTLSYNAGNILVHLNGILISEIVDYTASNGTSIVLNDAADSGDIVHISSFSTPSQTNLWREVTSTTYNAIAGHKLIVDASSSAVTVNLPSVASFGDEVKIIDGTGSSESNNITINRNGHKILGSDSDFTLDVDRVAVDLVYYNVNQGWIVSGNT